MNLQTADFKELKALSSPPRAVGDVLNAVLLILEEKTEWKNA